MTTAKVLKGLLNSKSVVTPWEYYNDPEYQINEKQQLFYFLELIENSIDNKYIKTWTGGFRFFYNYNIGNNKAEKFKIIAYYFIALFFYGFEGTFNITYEKHTNELQNLKHIDTTFLGIEIKVCLFAYVIYFYYYCCEKSYIKNVHLY